MSDFQNFLNETLDKVDFRLVREADDEFFSYDINKEIQEMVIKARNEADLTQKELAQRSGLTQANISNIEKGVRCPTIETLRKIADATGKRLIIEFAEQEVFF